MPGAHSDAAFGFVAKEDGASASEWGTSGIVTTLGTAWDSARRSDVIECETAAKRSFYIGDSASNLNANDTPWDSTRRTLSFWHKGDAMGVEIFITSSAGERRVKYDPGIGTNGLDGSGNAIIYLGMDFDTDIWQRFERNVEADYESVSGGASWTNTDGVLFGMGAGTSHRFDDIRLSDSLTVEHNVLAGGAVGQILRQRTYNSSTLAKTDRWFHYDQVGSVMCESDSGGALVDTHFHEAFGNTLAAWTTGLIGGDRAGRHHNTKEFDSDIGLVYMYQRWYSPELGIFVSSAPYPPMVEHRYSFAGQAPAMFVDPLGLLWKGIKKAVGSVLGKTWALPNTIVGVTIGLAGTGYGYIDGNPQDPKITFGNNAIQFEDNPFARRAYTLGNAVVYPGTYGPNSPAQRYDSKPPSPTATVGMHERAHTRQAEILGPFYGPVYLFGGMNPMERSADDYADSGDWSLF